jgi:hypothetical protein
MGLVQRHRGWIGAVDLDSNAILFRERRLSMLQ